MYRTFYNSYLQYDLLEVTPAHESRLIPWGFTSLLQASLESICGLSAGRVTRANYPYRKSLNTQQSSICTPVQSSLKGCIYAENSNPLDETVVEEFENQEMLGCVGGVERFLFLSHCRGFIAV